MWGTVYSGKGGRNYIIGDEEGAGGKEQIVASPYSLLLLQGIHVTQPREAAKIIVG